MEDKIIYKNYAYSINQNEFADKPDTWSDDLFLVYDHRSFCIERKEFYPPYINDYLNGDKDYDFSNFWIFPVYAYIHSGVNLSLNHNGDKWDTSMRGYILANKLEFTTEEFAKISAINLLEDWNMYLSGDVYYVKIYKLNSCIHCGNTEEEEVDNIDEVYGYDEAEQIAKECIDSYE